jgi:uncharacterized protein
MDGTSGISQQVDSFRAARRELEASVLPLATSVDGRRFTFQASLYGLELQSGGYAVLDDGGAPRLGQVVALELDLQKGAELTIPAAAHGGPKARTEVPIRLARGEGIIVDGGTGPFHDAVIRAAAGSDVRAWQQRSARPRAQLRLGELTLAVGVPCLPTPKVSTGTPSFAASPGRGRRTRSA